MRCWLGRIYGRLQTHLFILAKNPSFARVMISSNTTMPSPQFNNHAPLPVEPPGATSRSNSSTQASFEESGAFLEIPKSSPGGLMRGSHARSRSVGDSGGPSTALHFGQRKSSNFAPTLLNSYSPAGPKMPSSDAANQAQTTATSSLHPAGSQSGHHVDVFRFGQGDNDIPEPVFSFASLHNFTPLPSPRASPVVHSPNASLRNYTPSPGSSPLATASTPGSSLSPPKFSLNQSSSPSTSDITSRVRSLSLAVTQTDSLALSPSPRASSGEATEGRVQQVGSDARPKPYDPRDEPGPQHEYFTSTFQQKLRDGAAIAKETIAAIEKLRTTTELDGEIEQLLHEAKDMSSFRSEITRRIAILGDSGEGELSYSSDFSCSFGVLRLTAPREKQPHQLVAPFSRHSTNGNRPHSLCVGLENLT